MAEKANKKLHKNKTSKVVEDPLLTKKSSMKTASDVISRLLWDDSLSQDKFSVGYLDRFDGIVEKPFTTLDWRDPAIVDNHTLALPKHRIQYFKYCNRKVWDKRNRTDIVFGSTGYPLSIYQFLSKVDNELLNFHDEDVIPVGFVPTQVNNTACSGDPEETIDDDFEVADRPNFFIAARIDSEEPVGKLNEVSEYIKVRDQLLGECCIPSQMLHMTLSILKLDSPGEVSDAISALKALAAHKTSAITLALEGLDNFKQRVLYCRVEDNDSLMRLRKQLVHELTSRNLKITDRFSFVPHVTVAKLSRPITKLRHSKYIDQYLYLKFEDDVFGTQVIDKLYLCEMGAERREDGFYRCACELSLCAKT